MGKWSSLVSEFTEEVVFGLEVPWEYIFEGDDFSCERLHGKLIECLARSWSNIRVSNGLCEHLRACEQCVHFCEREQ